MLTSLSYSQSATDITYTIKSGETTRLFVDHAKFDLTTGASIHTVPFSGLSIIEGNTNFVHEYIADNTVSFTLHLEKSVTTDTTFKIYVNGEQKDIHIRPASSISDSNSDFDLKGNNFNVTLGLAISVTGVYTGAHIDITSSLGYFSTLMLSDPERFEINITSNLSSASNNNKSIPRNEDIRIFYKNGANFSSTGRLTLYLQRQLGTQDARGNLVRQFVFDYGDIGQASTNINIGFVTVGTQNVIGNLSYPTERDTGLSINYNYTGTETAANEKIIRNAYVVDQYNALTLSRLTIVDTSNNTYNTKLRLKKNSPILTVGKYTVTVFASRYNGTSVFINSSIIALDIRSENYYGNAPSIYIPQVEYKINESVYPYTVAVNSDIYASIEDVDVGDSLNIAILDPRFEFIGTQPYRMRVKAGATLNYESLPANNKKFPVTVLVSDRVANLTYATVTVSVANQADPVYLNSAVAANTPAAVSLDLTSTSTEFTIPVSLFLHDENRLSLSVATASSISYNANSRVISFASADYRSAATDGALTIHAYNTALNASQATYTLSIFVDPLPEFANLFSSVVEVEEIKDGSNLGTDYGLGRAIGVRDVRGREITLGLTGDSIFKLVTTSSGAATLSVSVQIKASTDLDFETKQIYVATLQAAQKDNPSKFTIERVTISLTNLNEDPFINRAIPTLYMNTYTDFSYILPQDFIQDPDFNDSLSYTKKDTSQYTWLNLNSSTGELSADADQIPKANNEFSFIIEAADAAGLDVEATIWITTHNIAPPTWSSSGSLTISLQEGVWTGGDVNTGIILKAVAASSSFINLSLDYGFKSDKLTLSIVSPNTQDEVSFNVQLKNNAVFDYEDNSGTYLATLSIANNLRAYSFAAVTISIININDEKPRINLGGLQKVLNENYGITASSGFDTGLDIEITDPDGDELDSDNIAKKLILGSDDFFIDNNHNLKVKKDSTFNYEETPYIPLTIIVNDGTFETKATVILSITDSNDPPRSRSNLNNSTIYIPANGQMATYTIPVNDFYDEDGDSMTFSASTTPSWASYDSSSKAFSIDSSKVISISSPQIKFKVSDGTVEPEFTLNVSAIALPSLTKVGSQTLIINENTPFDVNENTGLTISNPDNGSISFSSDKFTRRNDELVVKASTEFDYEATSGGNYKLTVYVRSTEGLTNSLVVDVAIRNVDENPNISVSGEQVLIKEDDTIRQEKSTGYQIIATDPEGNANVVLKPDHKDNEKFILKINGGYLSIKENAIFDYEEQHLYSVVLLATDTTDNTSESTVVISVHNEYDELGKPQNTPVFQVQSGSGLTIDILSLIKTDANRSGLTYEIKTGKPEWLEINNSILSGEAPQTLNVTRATIGIQVEQSYKLTPISAPDASTINFNIVVQINPNSYGQINEVILPRILDSIASQGIGVVANRVSSLAAGNVNNSISDELLAIVKDNRTKINNREVNIYELLSGRQIALGYHDGSLLGTDFGLWARFDFNDLESGDNDPITYDGGLSGLSSGFDYRFVDGGIIGLALSNYGGEIDFVSNTGSSKLEGTYDVGVNLFQPYYSNSFNALDYWLSFGIGSGEVEITEKGNANNSQNDISLLIGALGFDVEIFEFDRNRSLEIFGDIQQGNLVLEPNSVNLAETKLSNRNLRSGISYIQKQETATGSLHGTLGLALVNQAVAAKLDRSDWGYELFSEVSYLVHSLPLRFNGDISYISINSTGQKQISGGLLINYRNDSSNLGYFMELSPAYRSKSQTDLFDLSTNNADNFIGEAPRLLFTSELGYGFGVTGGILTPYGNYAIDDTSAKYGLGLRYLHADRLSLGLGLNRGDNKLDETKLEMQYKIIDY